MNSRWDVPGNKHVKSVSLKIYSLVLSLGVVENPSHLSAIYKLISLAGIFISHLDVELI